MIVRVIPRVILRSSMYPFKKYGYVESPVCPIFSGYVGAEEEYEKPVLEDEPAEAPLIKKEQVFVDPLNVIPTKFHEFAVSVPVDVNEAELPDAPLVKERLIVEEDI